MASAEEIYRESQARLHRILGSYLSLEAWKEGLDCVVLERGTLLGFLALERMKNKRIDWLKEDLEDIFPFARTTSNSKTGAYATLYISRFEIPKGNSIWKSMKTKERVQLLTKNGLTSAIMNIPEERKLLSKMALVSNGIETI